MIDCSGEEFSWTMDTKKITRAALGSTASLGFLYDARCDDFCGMSIFKKSIPENVVIVQDANFSDIRLVHSDNFSEKAAKLDVSAELQVSVLAGLLSLKGSGRYLVDQKQSARTVKSSLVYNIKTKDELLNIFHEDLRDTFSIDAIESDLATHVVVGISWGANSVLSCFYENKENRDVKEIAGTLSAELKKATLSISGNAKVDCNENDKADGITFEIQVYGDIVSEKKLPTTFEKALEFMTEVPTMIKTCNEGKGKPLAYHLLPVKLLKNYLNLAMGANIIIKSLEEASLAQVVQMFEHASQAKQNLNDFYQDVLSNKCCVKQQDLRVISEFINEAVVHETSFRTKLAKVLQEIRSGKCDMDRLGTLLGDFQSSTWSPVTVATKLEEWSYITQKIQFMQILKTHGIKYIGYGTELRTEMFHDFDAIYYVMYFTHDAKNKETERFNKNLQVFFHEVKKQTGGHKFFAVDCDIHPYLNDKNHLSCVQTIQFGTVLAEDLLARQQQQQASQFPLVHAVHDATEPVMSWPTKTVPLELPCTGYTCNPNKKYEWKCKKCQTLIEYGFDDHVYCVCGKTPVNCLEFRCTDSSHGINYEKHDRAFLNQLLSTMRPLSELNILIMGETGVGKSTWINAFVNYMTHETLENAEAGELITLIPSKFTVCNDEYDEVTVCTGSDDNEILQDGQSATQAAKVYTFTAGTTTVRLFDTPGIGDTRGVEQDKINFKNILVTLSQIDEIHGICILLKPNNARLTVMFRFCIKELLVHLHRDASRNIVFCFTKSRGTSYRPEDTMPLLKKMLTENNDVEISINRNTIYCYDSEAYRYLAALKNEHTVTFPMEERLNFFKSWQKSFEETKRMLEHLKGLPPHDVSSTLGLNHAREVILLLQQPLAEVTRNVQKKKEAITMEKMELEAAEEDLEKLRQKQTVTCTEIQLKALDPPKIICPNGDLLDIEETGFNSYPDYLYPAALELITFRITNFMARYLCRSCTQIEFRHKTKYFTVVKVEVAVDVTDDSVNELMEQKLSAQELKKKMIEAKDQEIEECESEQLKMEQVSARFACFLKSNAISTYNDGMEQYLNHLIREEENKEPNEKSITTLDSLKKSKQSYLEQKELLEKEIGRGMCTSNEETPRPKDVDRWVKELLGLKHSGKALTEAFGYIDQTNNTLQNEVYKASTTLTS